MKSFDELYSGLLNRVQEDIVNPSTTTTPLPTTPTATPSTPATGTTVNNTPPTPPTTTAATANHVLVTQIATMKDPAAIAALLSKNNVMLPINTIK